MRPSIERAVITLVDEIPFMNEEQRLNIIDLIMDGYCTLCGHELPVCDCTRAV